MRTGRSRCPIASIRSWSQLFVIFVRSGAIIATIRSWAIVAIIRSRPVIAPRPIVLIVARLVVSIGVLFKHRAAGCAELWGISAQACHNPVHVGNVRAA